MAKKYFSLTDWYWKLFFKLSEISDKSFKQSK